MKRVTIFTGRNGIEGEISREELEFLLYYDLATFSGSRWNQAKRIFEDKWRYKRW